MHHPTVIRTLVLVSALAASLRAEVKIEETIAGPVNAGGLYVVSQNEARVAYVGAKGTRTVVTVDGVEGPVLDELFNGSAAVIGNAGQLLVHNANAGGKFNGTPTAVIFSEAGAHYAYIGRQGNDYVVVHDGREIGRGPRAALGLQHMPLGLSPTGKHAFWGEMKIENGRGTYRLIMDGKPEPWAGHQDLKPVFSPDDSRYAYLASAADDYRKPVLIVDGKVASYVGGQPLFTADNKLLIPAADLKGVFVDGRRVALEGISIEKIVPAPVGGRYAVIMRKKLVNYRGVGTLYLDGREVSGTEGAADITFSPDGKRWALRCLNPEAGSAFMVIDGKKGSEYQTVSDGAFWTSDSSKVIYQITSSGRNFVVVDTEEFAVGLLNSLMRSPFVFTKTGSRYSFSSGDPSNRSSLTIVDGKQILPAGVYAYSDSFEFSASGNRYAFVIGPIGRQGTAGIIDNGALIDKLPVASFQKTAGELERYFVLSPDGRHMARPSYEQNRQGLYVDEKLVYSAAMGGIAYATFTPDSKHLFWLATEKTAEPNTIEHVVYVDGQPTIKLARGVMLGGKGAWQMDAKGAVTLLGVNGNNVKRYRIAASDDMDVEKMITRAEEAQAAAIAAAKKAEADRLAAAEAKARADAAAAAKAKADAAAAAAARAKARQDALDARAKARADAAAARAANQRK
jgi:hypothetical protein